MTTAHIAELSGRRRGADCSNRPESMQEMRLIYRALWRSSFAARQLFETQPENLVRQCVACRDDKSERDKYFIRPFGKAGQGRADRCKQQSR